MPLTSEGKRLVNCPKYRGRMTNLGLDFKPPRQANIEQWKKVELLYRYGYTYHSCGCAGPGPRPAHLREVALYVREQKQAAVRASQTIVIRNRADQLHKKRKRCMELQYTRMVSRAAREK